MNPNIFRRENVFRPCIRTFYPRVRCSARPRYARGSPVHHRHICVYTAHSRIIIIVCTYTRVLLVDGLYLIDYRIRVYINMYIHACVYIRCCTSVFPCACFGERVWAVRACACINKWQWLTESRVLSRWTSIRATAGLGSVDRECSRAHTRIERVIGSRAYSLCVVVVARMPRTHARTLCTMFVRLKHNNDLC